jgi:hypothetical protein
MTIAPATCAVHRWYTPDSGDGIALCTCLECGENQWQATNGSMQMVKEANRRNARDGYPLIQLNQHPSSLPAVPAPQRVMVVPMPVKTPTVNKVVPAAGRKPEPVKEKKRRPPREKKPKKPVKVWTSSGKHQHRWTEEELGLVRLHYDGTRASVESLCRITGATFFGVKGQIMRLGLARVKPADWSEKELIYLERHIHRQSVKTISKALGRSINAIKVKATRLHYKLRDRDGWYTKREVSEICGVDHHRVQSWIDHNELKASYHFPGCKPTKKGLAMWHIEEKDFAAFLKAHCQELQGRNIDIFQILTICGVMDADN